MKSLRCWIKKMAVVGCGALVLSFIASNAMADKQAQGLWPRGAKLVLNSYPGGPGTLGPHTTVTWPTASGADHYRLTVYKKTSQGLNVVVDRTPIYVTGTTIGGVLSGYTVVVTAYSIPDETMAYSESLQSRIR